MCGSMVDIQSPTTEIRRGKKKEETTGWKYIWPALLHRVAINHGITTFIGKCRCDHTKYFACFSICFLTMCGFKSAVSWTPSSLWSLTVFKFWLSILYWNFWFILPMCMTLHLDVLKGSCQVSDHWFKAWFSLANTFVFVKRCDFH